MDVHGYESFTHSYSAWTSIVFLLVTGIAKAFGSTKSNEVYAFFLTLNSSLSTLLYSLSTTELLSRLHRDYIETVSRVNREIITLIFIKNPLKKQKKCQKTCISPFFFVTLRPILFGRLRKCNTHVQIQNRT